MNVTENPYQSPTDITEEPAVPQHQSFRLTQDSTAPDASLPIDTFRDAVIFTLVLQIPLLLITALILDGGLIFKRVAIASVAFWILTLIIKIRRRPKLPDSDVLLVKWGYLPVLLITCIMWIIGSWTRKKWSVRSLTTVPTRQV